jgi:hypothetical protein
VPPTTLARARGPFAAAGPAAADTSNAAQMSAIPTLAVRDIITKPIDSASYRLNLNPRETLSVAPVVGSVAV